jgi:flagellar FliL protein
MAKKKTAAPEEGAEPKKKSKKKLVMVLLLLVVLGAGGFGYKTMTKKPMAAKGSPTTTVAGPITEEASLTVNLSDAHYLEFTAAIQTNPGKSDVILTTDQAIVLDILNTQAGATTEAQLLAPGGATRLKADMLQALNREWPGLVQAVYFEQFVMQ